MAIAKKKAKKKAKKAPRKKASKKKASKKKATRRKKKGPTLRKVPHTQYELVWDEGMDKCHFGHSKGAAGPVGCGVSDTVMVYTDGKAYFILSMNYTEGYACVEMIDEEGVAAICFADPAEMVKMLGDLSKAAPKNVATELAARCV